MSAPFRMYPMPYPIVQKVGYTGVTQLSSGPHLCEEATRLGAFGSDAIQLMPLNHHRACCS